MWRQNVNALISWLVFLFVPLVSGQVFRKSTFEGTLGDKTYETAGRSLGMCWKRPFPLLYGYHRPTFAGDRRQEPSAQPNTAVLQLSRRHRWRTRGDNAVGLVVDSGNHNASEMGHWFDKLWRSGSRLHPRLRDDCRKGWTNQKWKSLRGSRVRLRQPCHGEAPYVRAGGVFPRVFAACQGGRGNQHE